MALTFLNPWLLSGAIFVIVPVLLHLWRRKPVPVLFPAIQFLRRAEQAARRKLRLREWLLLLVRVLAILALVSALARPVWGPGTREVDSGARELTPVVFVFDTSVRMDYQESGETRLDRAKRWAAQVLASLPSDIRLAIVDCHGGPLGFEVDRASAQARIRRLTVAPGTIAVAAALVRAIQLLQSEDNAGRLLVFSDLSRPGWPEATLPAVREQLASLPGVSVYLFDVGSENSANYALGDLEINPAVVAPGGVVYLRTNVEGTFAASRTVELRLAEPGGKLAGDPETDYQIRGTQTVSVTPDQSARVEFAVSLAKEGIYQGIVRLVGRDPFTWDNQRFFTVWVRPPEKILVIAPVEKFPDTIYLREMLAPEILTKLARARFQWAAVEQPRWNQVDFSSFSVIVLADPEPLEPALADRLKEFVEQGGGLAVFLGGKAGNPEKWFTESLRGLLPARPIRQARAPNGVVLQPMGYQHPVFKPLERYADRLPWDLAPVVRYWQVELLSEDTFIIAAFSDGQPAILERKVGSGRVLLMTTPLTDPPREGAWNLLVSGDCWSILPMVHHMMLYLSGAEEFGGQFWAGPRLSVSLPEEPPAAPLLIPTASVDSRSPPVVEKKGKTAEFRAVDLLGNYVVVKGEEDHNPLAGFSINLPAQQSDLRRVDPQVLASLAPNQITLARQADGLPPFGFEGGGQVELSPYLLLLAVAFFIGEWILANRFYSEARPGNQRLSS